MKLCKYDDSKIRLSLYHACLEYGRYITYLMIWQRTDKVYSCRKSRIYRLSHINLAASMGLNYDLGDKSENFRRMNHFEKFNKANRIFFLQKMLDFSSIICVFWR